MRDPNLHLPYAEWPKADRDLWAAATTNDDPFGEALGAGLAPATVKRYLFGWRRFLGFLAITEPSALELPPVERITRERIRSFVDHLAATNTPQSVALQVEATYHAIRIMLPDQKWSWFRSVKSRLHETAPPTKSRSPVITSVQLLDLGLALMAETVPQPRKRLRMIDAVHYRDGLMIALLAFMPLRRKNLAALQIGRELIREGETWFVVIPGQDAKTKTPIEFEVPAVLLEYLTTYLEIIRARMLRRANCSALWVSPKGGPLSYSAVWGAITRHTANRLGIHVTPHDGRDAAATTWAIAAPEKVGVARDLLGHKDLRTITRHYNRARGIEASRAYRQLVSRRMG